MTSSKSRSTSSPPRPMGAIVYLNRWWVVDQDGAYFYDPPHWIPQCNRQQVVTERLTDRLYPDATACFIPIAYVPQRCPPEGLNL